MPTRIIILNEDNMKKIPLVTPGEILKEEFLMPLKISAYKLAKDTNMPATRISEIIKKNYGKHGIKII